MRVLCVGVGVGVWVGGWVGACVLCVGDEWVGGWVFVAAPHPAHSVTNCSPPAAANHAQVTVQAQGAVIEGVQLSTASIDKQPALQVEPGSSLRMVGVTAQVGGAANVTKKSWLPVVEGAQRGSTSSPPFKWG